MDDFKDINDTYGHFMGDRILKVIGDVLTSSFRSTDIIGRIGGDEFLVFVPDCDEDGVAAFRKAFESYLEKRNQNATFVVGASIGARVITLEKDTNMDECVRDSDEAMYKEKKRRHAELKQHAMSLK